MNVTSKDLTPSFCLSPKIRDDHAALSLISHIEGLEDVLGIQME